MCCEGHHARAHEAVLQLGRDARLLHEQALRLRRQVREQLLELERSLTDSASARESCCMVE